MTEKTSEDGFLISDEFLDEGPSQLEVVLLEALDRDRVGMADKTWRNHRQAIRKIIPQLENAGIFTLEQLTDTDALLALRESLSLSIQDGSLGSAGTVEAYTGKFASRCASAGLSDSDTKRIRGTFRQARKEASQVREVEPELTEHHIRSLVDTMHSWLDHPTEIRGRKGRGGTDVEVMVGIYGYKGRQLTPLRRDRALGLAALQLSGSIRTGSALVMTRGDVQGERVRFMLKKGRVDPEMREFDIHPSQMIFLAPLLERFPNPGDRLFSKQSDQVGADLRALMIQAGIPEHHGRLGLHRVRKAFFKANYDAGLSASEASAGLGNSPMVAERAYATHTRRDRGRKSREAWMDALTAALEEPPEWKFEDEPIPWNKLPPWSSTEDPLNLGPALSVDLPEGSDTSGLKCLWRMRYVVVKEKDDGSDWWFDGWRRYGAFESVLDDVVIPWHSLGSSRKCTPLWLSRGGMANKWWACLDSNQGHVLPILESLIPGYAAAMLEALESGDLDDLARMLGLLEALGGPR